MNSEFYRKKLFYNETLNDLGSFMSFLLIKIRKRIQKEFNRTN